MGGKQSSNRRSIRLAGYNYAGPGTVFVTICTHDGQHLFGSMRDGEMHLSMLGEIAHQQWNATLDMRTEMIDHGWIIMPNHMHAMFTLDNGDDHPKETREYGKRIKRSVGSIVAGYKSAVTSRARKETGHPGLIVWQRDYNDHVVRDPNRFNAIYEYIPANPSRWRTDVYNKYK